MSICPDGDGLDLLDIIRRDYPQTVVIVITGYGTIESAVKAIKQGAYDYLTKPIIDDELRLAVERAIKQQSLMSENESLAIAARAKVQAGEHHQPQLQDGEDFRPCRGGRRQQDDDTDGWPIGHGQEYAGKSDPPPFEPAR